MSGDKPQTVALVEFIAKHLVDKPDEVVVEEVETQRGLVLELSVADGDIGKVIGKEGRTAQAIRSLLQAGAPAGGKRIQLDIVE